MNYTIIPLTKGKVARVDADDAAWLSACKWRLNSKGYAIRSFYVDGKEIVVNMHREIVSAPKGLYVDHIDNDRTNNVKSNLRICTASENLSNRGVFSSNTTGFIGVSCHAHGWRSTIQVDERILFLGLFEDLHRAALVRDHAANLLYREFARLNLPDQRIPLIERRHAEQRLTQYGYAPDADNRWRLATKLAEPE